MLKGIMRWAAYIVAAVLILAGFVGAAFVASIVVTIITGALCVVVVVGLIVALLRAIFEPQSGPSDQ